MNHPKPPPEAMAATTSVKPPSMPMMVAISNLYSTSSGNAASPMSADGYILSPMKANEQITYQPLDFVS
jgi:hypothetical protein